MLKVKIIGLYKKVHVWCVAQKRVKSQNTNNGGDIQKFLAGSKFTTTGIPGNYIYQGILSVFQEQT